MAQFDLNRAQDTPRPTLKLNEIAFKNWRRYPSVPISKAMTNRIDIPTVTYTGGVANTGAAAGNDGEVGTINSTGATRGVAWNTQAEKETALGMPIATDVTKSYHGTRGVIEPAERYPSTNAAETLPAFRRSNYIIPGTP